MNLSNNHLPLLLVCVSLYPSVTIISASALVSYLDREWTSYHQEVGDKSKKSILDDIYIDDKHTDLDHLVGNYFKAKFGKNPNCDHDPIPDALSNDDPMSNKVNGDMFCVLF